MLLGINTIHFRKINVTVTDIFGCNVQKIISTKFW